MKQKQLPKSFFLVVLSISLTSFLIVNVHASLTLKQSLPVPILQDSQVNQDEKGDTYDIPTPDISILGRVVELAQRLLPATR
jgi:hypothetical protein